MACFETNKGEVAATAQSNHSGRLEIWNRSARRLDRVAKITSLEVWFYLYPDMGSF